MDIRMMTALIVRRGTQFLVSRIIGSTEFRWSDSPWEAWRTRDRDAAKRVAHAVGGDLMLFNPVAGQIREAMV